MSVKLFVKEKQELYLNEDEVTAKIKVNIVKEKQELYLNNDFFGKPLSLLTC